MPKTLNTQLEDGLLIVRFDHADKSVNTFSPEALDELEAVVASLEENDATAAGVVFTSGKPGVFITGADLFALNQMEGDDVDRFLERGQRLFDRVAALPMPTVAAINGTCLGGGMELALACDHRVAADIGSINLGLPEVKIGIVPAWGGTTRVTQMLGPAAALPLLMTGNPMSPRKAQRKGLIDEVVRPEALLAAGMRLAKTPAPARHPSRMARMLGASPLRPLVLRSARKQTLAKTYGNYPAAEAIIDVVDEVCRDGHEAGLAAERLAVRKLRNMDGCRNLMRLFFLRHASKRAVTSQLHAQPIEVEHAAVIGGGAMGAGITHALVKAGVQVRLVEINPEAAAAAVGRVQKMLAGDLKSKRLSPLEVEQAMDRVSTTLDWSGLGVADLVVEAVAETMEIKREVFRKLDERTRPEAVLATNTSSLDITELAEGTRHPSRVIGLHFFNPVPKMPLVEVIRTRHSADAPLATGVATAMRLGKTPVLVNDGPGFVVNRVLIPYLAEALAMAAEGQPIGDIDTALKHWGMPMGPFELLDQVGLDVAGHILRSLGGKLGDHLKVPEAVEAAIARGDIGRKSGLGFYDYAGKQPKLNPALAEALRHGGSEPPKFDADETCWRLMAPMINEAAKLLHEGVADSAETLDLTTVLGLGLAPFRGGLVRFAETAGLDTVIHHADELGARYGLHLMPPQTLRRLAESGGSMQDLVQVQPVNHGVAANGHAAPTAPHA